MKKSQSLEQILSRRRFLFRGACAGLGVTSIVNTLAHLTLIQRAVAQATTLPDYKAMVCVFLYGGNDSNNMLLPRNGIARTNYGAARPVGHPLHIPLPNAGDPTAMLSLSTPGIFGTPHATAFGVHPSMPNTRTYFNNGNLAFLANAGTLVEPIADNAEYTSGLKSLPPQLFSHSDQQLQWQSSIPDRPFQSGWGGRVADLLRDTYSPAQEKVSMNISISGQNNFQVGRTVVPYSVGTGGVLNLTGYGTNYSSSADYSVQPPAYSNNDSGRTLKALDRITGLVHEHLLEEGYNHIMRNARDKERQVGDALALSTSGASGTTVGNAIHDAFVNAFPGVTDLPDIADQLEMVARLINGRVDLQNQRQIFFVSMGGFDTHDGQIRSHAELMAKLSHALVYFDTTLGAIGARNKVTTFTASDFGRTFTSNGDGTDHGWGSHHFVMGGAVRGGDLYGSFPQLGTKNANNNAFDSSPNQIDNGALLPETSVDQLGATLARWFGLDDGQLTDVFPSLANFDAGKRNLGFMG